MIRTKLLGQGVIATVLGAVLFGCNSEPQTEPNATTNTAPIKPASKEEAKVNEAMAKLSPADRTLAEAQKNCPVTDEPLGSMGVPIKVTVEGRDVFVCCEGCIEELKSDFAKYAAKLEK